jgi:hypothetical protein
VSTGQWGPAQERIEFAALEREYECVLQGFRLESLARRLHERAPLAVRDSRCGITGDRWRLALDDDRVLKLKLYWPHRERAAALCSLTWVDDEGWRADVRTTAGDRLVLRAFHASLDC